MTEVQNMTIKTITLKQNLFIKTFFKTFQKYAK